MTQGTAPELVVLELTLSEALTVLTALRQYMPYWRTVDELSPAQQLEHSRVEVHTLISKIQAAA